MDKKELKDIESSLTNFKTRYELPKDTLCPKEDLPHNVYKKGEYVKLEEKKP